MIETILKAFSTLTPWTVVGYLGAALFSIRWLVQMVYSHKHQKPTLPRLFWYISILGSIMLLSYFTFGINDPVGIISNFFPVFIAVFNLFLDIKNKNKDKMEQDKIAQEKLAQEKAAQ